MLSPVRSENIQWMGGTVPSMGMATSDTRSSSARATSSTEAQVARHQVTRKGGWRGRVPGRASRGKVGKRAVVELAAHQALLVEALIQGRGGTQHQGADAHRSVGRRTAGGRLQIALQLGTAGVEHLSPWYKGHLAVRRNAVEIEVAPPQVSAVRRLPRHRAAPGGQVAQQRPRPALVRIHLLRLLLEPMCLWYTVCH